LIKTLVTGEQYAAAMIDSEDPTRPDIIDAYAPVDDPYQPNYHAPPRAIPDHGRQPRRPERPTKAVYDRDRANTYRPVNHPLVAARDDVETADSPRFSKHREVARLLTKTARNHAPRLSWRRDAAIAEVIEREVLPDARFVAAALPVDIRAKVLAKFTEVLWEEIALVRQNRRNTKT